MKRWIFLILFVCHFAGLSALHKFAVITPEKTGTHLLTKQLTLLTGMEVMNSWKHNAPQGVIHKMLDECEAGDKYFHMHAVYHKHIMRCFSKRDYRVFYLLRDPRDQLISMLNYIRNKGWAYGPLRMDYPFGKLSYDQQIEEMITGSRYGISVPHAIFTSRKKWISQKGVLTVKFEDLVGTKGGGSKDRQMYALHAIVDHLKLPKTESELATVAENSFGKPGEKTFNKGQIGEWKSKFKDYHKSLFKTIFGNELIEMGYEENFNW